MDTRWREDSEEEEFMESRARKRRAIVEETDDESEEDSNKDEEVSSEEEDMETGEENVDGIDVAESLYHSDDSHISEASVSSMGSSSGDGRDQCPVCLMTLKGQQLGKPNNCQHVFCLECIQEWAKNVNTCPVDRKTFNQIFVHNSKKGPVISKIKVEDRQMEEQFEEDEPTFCEVCNQCDREDVLLLCDGCDRGYHMDCLTPPLYRVPVEEWYCHQCRHDNQTEDMEESAAINRETLRVTSQTRSRGPRVRSHGRAATRRATADDPSRDPSSESEFRARTVASIRNRRTTHRRRRSRGRSRGSSSRGRTSTSSRPRVKTRKRRRRTKTKRKTKTKASTSTGKRVTKKRSKKGKKTKAKRPRVERGEPGEEVEPRQARLKGTVRGRLRDSIQANASNSSWELRTLGKCAFPSRLEPTLSFAIFGNQLSLETPPELPQCESLGSTRAEQDRSRVSLERTRVGNPDLLGSIFEGLETLHSRDASVTREGNVKRKNVEQMGKETPIVCETGQTGNTSQSGVTGQADETAQVGKTAQAGVTVQAGKTGQACHSGETSQTSQTSQSLKRKGTTLKVKFKLPGDKDSIKDDGTAESNQVEPQIKEENTKNEIKPVFESKQVVNYISAEKCSSKSFKFENQETNCEENQLSETPTTSNSDYISDLPRCHGNSLTSIDDKAVERSPSVVKISSVRKRPSSSHSVTQKTTRAMVGLPPKLSSYKIPKIIHSTNARPLKQEELSTNANSDVRTISEKISGSRENCGNNSRFYNTVMGTTETPSNQASALRKRNTPMVESRSSSSSFSGDETIKVPPWKWVCVSKDFMANEQSKTNIEKVLPSSQRHPLLKLSNSASSTAQKSVHFGSSSEPSRCIPDWGLDKSNDYGPQAPNMTVTETDTRKKQNLDIINTLRHKTLDLRAQLLREMQSGESSLTELSTSLWETEGGCNLSNPNSTGAFTNGSHSVHVENLTSPVAVVKPTPQVQSSGAVQCPTVTSGDEVKSKDFHTEEERERQKRRSQGIERFRRLAEITDEVKHALKPYYKHRAVSKAEYKDIYKRAVKKINESSSRVDRERVTSLVGKYVKHVKGKQTEET